MNIDEPTASQTVVFYVEDDPVNVLLMRMLFDCRPELRLEVATSGLQALGMAPRLRPSLLLLDMRLPDCIGAQLLPLLRRVPGWQDLPAVAVTAEPGFATAGGGFLEVWTKPIDVRGTLRRLDELLGSSAPAMPSRRIAGSAAASNRVS